MKFKGMHVIVWQLPFIDMLCQALFKVLYMHYNI